MIFLPAWGRMPVPSQPEVTPGTPRRAAFYSFCSIVSASGWHPSNRRGSIKEPRDDRRSNRGILAPVGIRRSIVVRRNPAGVDVSGLATPDWDFPGDRAILPAMKRPREVIQPRWGVYLLKRKAEPFPFTVGGRNPQEAIERAVKEYDIAECERWRLSVQREA
jgi:hypothetical protein